MRILLDTSPLNSGHAGRGIGAYTRNLLAALQDKDDVDVIAEAYTHKRARDLDIVHFPYFDLFFATMPSVKEPSVVTIHDVIPLQFPAQYPIGFKGRWAHLRQVGRLGSINHIVTDSQTSKDRIVELLGVQSNKISVVYLAANPMLFPASTKEIANSKRKFNLKSPYVLYVGDINYNKNLPELIKSFRYLPNDLQLVMVGNNFYQQEIPEWEAIERQLAAVGMLDKVKLITNIPPENTAELAAVYSGAECYVQPSLEEGFGLPVLEAMRCGTPVVASNCGAHTEIAGESAWLVDPEAEAIAGGIKAVLHLSEKEREQIIRVGHAWEKEFTWDKAAEEMIRIYARVSNGI